MCFPGFALDFHAFVPWPDSVCILFGNLELRVSHLQRSANSLLDNHVESLPGDHFQDSAKDIEAVGVVPVATWLSFQGKLRKCIAPLFQSGNAATFCGFTKLLIDLVVRSFHRRPWVIQCGTVAEARGMRQKLSQCDDLLAGLVLLLASLWKDRHGCKCRDVLRNWIVKVDVSVAFLEVCHEGGRHEALRHGEEADDGVIGHFDLPFCILKASILIVHQASVANNAASNTSKVLHAGSPLNVLAYSLQRLPLHADTLRRA
mmetsp:Transcript_71753/g.126663  ORF Transcript_71753/g.126663 Transcript_71753/m.126663 type:complete len:260 (+) Transcript_71753:1296-2075(+)